MQIKRAEDFFTEDQLTAIAKHNNELWADAVEAMSLRAMPLVRQGLSPAEAVMRAYNAPDMKAVYKTPVMRAVLDQVVKWDKGGI